MTTPSAAPPSRLLAGAPRALLLALILLPSLLPSPATAQVVERERQVDVLPVRGILEIGPELRSRLQLFPEVTGFRAARLFLRDDGTAVLEIEALRDGTLQRERRFLDEPELARFRDQLVQAMADTGTPGVLNQEGRGGLVLGQTMLGLGYYGWAVPAAIDVGSSQAAVAAYLLTAGAAFYLPYRLTRDREVTDLHRDLTFYGSSRGILAGLFLGDALREEGGSGRITLAGGLVVGATGAFAGFHWADRVRVDDGTGALWRGMGDIGFAAGALAAFAAGPYANEDVVTRHGDDVVFIESRTRNRRLGHLITVAGGGAGLATGRWLGERERYSEGDVTALSSTALLGAQTGLTVARALTEEERGGAAAAVVGGAAGVYLGNRLLRRTSFSEGEGLLLGAGHIAGAAGALGLTYLVTSETSDHAVLYLTTATLGSYLGFGLVWRALSPGSGPHVPGVGEWGSGSAVGGGPARTHGASVEFQPANLLLSAVAPSGSGGRGMSSAPPPWLTIRW